MKKIVLIFGILSSFLFAGSGQNGVAKFKAEDIVSFSKQVETTMAKEGAIVAILGRVGRAKEDLPEGISFTHTAYAVYSDIKTDDGKNLKGYAIYNLYQKAEDLSISDLVIDFPVDFFSSVEELEAGILIPKPEIQEKLLKTIASESYKKVHNPKYSVIANPYTLDKQNCTEHTLDVLFAAIHNTDNINLIKEKEKETFKALTLNINPLKLMFGSMFVSEVSISDHPNGTTETTTFTTIGNYLEQEKLLDKKILVKFLN